MFQIVISTVQKEDISSTASIIQHSLPTNETVYFNKMPFGISLSGVNISDESISYFDIVFRQQTMYNASPHS